MKKQKFKLNEILEKEIKKARIKKVKYLKGTIKTRRGYSYGGCFIKKREIWIPKANSQLMLATGLHEIGHIRHGDLKSKNRGEFIAYKFVVRKFKQYGLKMDKKTIQRHKNSLKHHLVNEFNESQKIPRIDNEVIKFIGSTYCQDMINKMTIVKTKNNLIK